MIHIGTVQGRKKCRYQRNLKSNFINLRTVQTEGNLLVQNSLQQACRKLVKG